jgi:hypothetical protein
MAMQMVFSDIGAYSSKPSAEFVSENEELE